MTKKNVVKQLLSLIQPLSLADANTSFSLDPKVILSKALENKQKLTYKFSSTFTYPNLGLKAYEVFYNKANSDGTNYSRLDECEIKDGKVMVNKKSYSYIINKDGCYSTTANSVYKLNFEDKYQPYGIRKNIPTEGESANYQIEEALVNGICCYKITKRVELDNYSFKNFKKYITAWYISRYNSKELQLEYERIFPKKQIYYIAKKELLPIRYQYFNSFKEMIFDYTFSKIEFLSHIDDEIFEIPENIPKKIVDSQEMFMNELESEFISNLN